MHYKITVRAPDQQGMALAWITELHAAWLKNFRSSSPQPYTFEPNVSPFNAGGEDWCADCSTFVTINVYETEGNRNRLRGFDFLGEYISAREVPQRVARLLRCMKVDALKHKRQVA